MDGEAFVFDIGRVGIDLSLEAFLGGDNCVLLDWFKTQASSTTSPTRWPALINSTAIYRLIPRLHFDSVAA